MNRTIVVTVSLAAFLVSGCSTGVVKKRFRVTTDPPDAQIRVVSGVTLKELKYRSPAVVVAEAPKNPALSAKAILEVSRAEYLTRIVPLQDIHDGDTLSMKLERVARELARYRLSFRLVGPAASPELRFRDNSIAISFEVADQSFRMRFENLSAHEAKILWERAEYVDASTQRHRIMHSGIRFQDRNNPIPDQTIPSRVSVQEAVIPVDSIYRSPQSHRYEIHPLFPLESEAAAELKGKSILLFIPVEIDRQIIPYNFRIEITDSVKEAVKGPAPSNGMR